MSTYIHFTEAEKEQARQTDLVELLRSQGERLKPSGREFEWRDGSEKVTVRGNLWFHQYEEVGGDAIDFVRRFYNKNYPEAMQYLLGGCSGRLVVSPPIQKEPPPPFELPPKNDNMRRVYAYLLNKRGIDRDVLYAFAHAGMIYECAKYHNAIFVGFDKNGKAVHAHKRGTGSESSYGDTEKAEMLFNEIQKQKLDIVCSGLVDIILKSDRAMAMGDYKTVEAYHLKALTRSFPKLDKIETLLSNYHLGEVYEKLEDTNKAIEHYQYCVNFGGETAIKTSAIQKLQHIN